MERFNITPIPQVKMPQRESDIRPISLTPVLSKVLEDSVVSWMIELRMLASLLT